MLSVTGVWEGCLCLVSVLILELALVRGHVPTNLLSLPQQDSGENKMQKPHESSKIKAGKARHKEAKESKMICQIFQDLDNPLHDGEGECWGTSQDAVQTLLSCSQNTGVLSIPL